MVNAWSDVLLLTHMEQIPQDHIAIVPIAIKFCAMYLLYAIVPKGQIDYAVSYMDFKFSSTTKAFMCVASPVKVLLEM